MNFDHSIVYKGDISADKFTNLWLNPAQTWLSLGSAFDRSKQKIGLTAIQLGLPDMPNRSTASLRKAYGLLNLKKRSPRQELLHLELQKLKGNETQTPAQSLRIRHLCISLIKLGDHSWLNNDPACRRQRHFRRRGPQLDWGKREDDYCRRLEAMLPRIIARHQGNQKRIRAQTLIRELRASGAACYHGILNLMPRFREKFLAGVETPIVYMKRRLLYSLAETETPFLSARTLSKAATCYSYYCKGGEYQKLAEQLFALQHTTILTTGSLQD